MTLSIANAQALVCCDAVVDSCDLGSTNPQATLVIYSGTPPALVDTGLSGNTVLGQLAMTAPGSGGAFGNAIDANPGAIATANAIADDTAADNSGTGTFYRILDRNNVPRIQGTVGTSGTSLVLNNVDIQAGSIIEVVSLTVTFPEG